jgi:hypothetical protein
MAATPAANKPGAASSSAGQNAPSRKRRRNGNGTEEQTKALTGESVARKRRKGPVAVGILQLPFDLLFEVRRLRLWPDETCLYVERTS